MKDMMDKIKASVPKLYRSLIYTARNTERACKVNKASKDTVSARARELNFMQLGIKYYANFILPQKGNEAIEAELPTLEKERAAIKSELKRLKELA
jgi:hypothetical protein